MARLGAAGSGRPLVHQMGGVQIPDASPHRITVDFDVTILTSVYAPDASGGGQAHRWFGEISKYRKLITEFDLQPKYAITPTQFAIGNQFRHGLGLGANALGNGSTPPYQLEFEQLAAPVRVTPGIHRYGHFYIPTIRLAGVFETESFDELLQAFSGIIRDVVGPRRPLLTELAQLAGSCTRDGIVTLGKVRTHARLELSSSQGAVDETYLAEWLSTHRRAIVATHIAQDPRQTVDPRLERALWESNSELNLKSQSELLIVNAQGSTLIAPNRRGAAGSTRKVPPQYLNRHGRVVLLSEVGTAMQHALLRAPTLPEVAQQGWGADPRVVERWVTFPSNVFHTSVSNERIWSAISDSLGLRSLVQELREIGPAVRESRAAGKG